MKQNKNNMPVWKTRIAKNGPTFFQKVGNSLDVDKRLYKENIRTSIVHTEMLFKQKIITFKVKNKIIWGLNKIKNEIIKKKFEFNNNYEDIHMNIEKRLFSIGRNTSFLFFDCSRCNCFMSNLILSHVNNRISPILCPNSYAICTINPMLRNL